LLKTKQLKDGCKIASPLLVLPYYAGFSASRLPNHVRELFMTQINLPQPHEQRKVENLLVKLSKMKPISAKPAPIALGKAALIAACTAHPQVFFST
jgi:hypothetical protein